MNRYMVCHVPKSLFRYVPHFCETELKSFFIENKADYNMVAMVDANDMDKVYELTNSINTGWWNNEAVESPYTDENGQRSTSMGDIIINGENEIFIVAPFGFVKVDEKL